MAVEVANSALVYCVNLDSCGPSWLNKSMTTHLLSNKHTNLDKILPLGIQMLKVFMLKFFLSVNFFSKNPNNFVIIYMSIFFSEKLVKNAPFKNEIGQEISTKQLV